MNRLEAYVAPQPERDNLDKELKAKDGGEDNVGRLKIFVNLQR
jgi:hypothetical protein